MDLVSLYCSGESFEKAVTLILNAYRSSPSFYNSFDKIYIFYLNDLPKGKQDNRLIPGSLDFYKGLGRVIPDCSTILDRLYFNELISLDRKEKLLNILEDNYDKKKLLYRCLPYSILETDIEKIIRKQVCMDFPNVELICLDFLTLFKEYINRIKFDFYSKLYGLNRNLEVSCYDIYNYNIEKTCRMFNRISRDILWSPNVYLFVELIKLHCDLYLKNDYVFGFRHMTRYPRVSYVEVIDNIDKDKRIEEPKNVLYGELLDLYKQQYKGDFTSILLKDEIQTIIHKK